ncbi:LysR family transcriptional regulator [Psychromonas sp. Urea-02u-13]|uniref:LysR family transcriptional regulator n=1 Tax=Psychromonas sp. Urea-02u-13 TaxID=2058326 RepID=UPI000C3473A8|nr:LysR family transcriptional regulator [Psychromonas sp. Urea-02u-13]PKG38126.1 LysR family transcriptional regulator [Psychromonas sp. Urea-02u-13]
MDNWLGINEFVAVVETASFTKAATQLNTSVAQVSRKVASLEKRLASKLLLRTTRKITVTEAGLHYFQHCQSLVEGLKQADLALSDLSQVPKGLLKVTAPITYGEQVISPLLNTFMQSYPDLKLQLILSNQTLDLVHDNIDLAIRVGHLEDSTMMAKKLTQRQLYVCASPAYIEQYGLPFSLSELDNHNCLSSSSSLWAFNEQKKERNIRINGNISCNSGFALLDAAVKGIGLVQLPDYYVKDALKSGQLIECLSAYRAPLQGIWALYPNNRYLAVKVSLLIEFLASQLGYQ